MLRGGFIGFGRMGITHFSILNSHPNVEVVSVCDQSGMMLDILGKYVPVRTYTDPGRMLEESQLDFAIVSTPPDSHLEIVKQCIGRGLHVFVEKPMTLSAEESRKLVACVGDGKVVNQVGYVIRFNEVFSAAKQLLDAGLLGEIKNFNSEMFGCTVIRDNAGGWRSKKKMGGGCMYEFASHCIDIAVYFFGMPARVGGSVLQSIYSSQVEDLVSSNFMYDSGMSGSILVNWSDESYRKPTNIVKIFGTQGRMIADKHAYKVYLKQAAPEFGLEAGWNTRYITELAQGARFYVRGNEFTRQLDYFVESIEKQGRENVCSFAEALKTDILMEGIFRDAQKPATLLDEEYPGEPKVSDRAGKGFWKRLLSLMKRK